MGCATDARRGQQVEARDAAKHPAMIAPPTRNHSTLNVNSAEAENPWSDAVQMFQMEPACSSHPATLQGRRGGKVTASLLTLAGGHIQMSG